MYVRVHRYEYECVHACVMSHVSMRVWADMLICIIVYILYEYAHVRIACLCMCHQSADAHAGVCTHMRVFIWICMCVCTACVLDNACMCVRVHLFIRATVVYEHIMCVYEYMCVCIRNRSRLCVWECERAIAPIYYFLSFAINIVRKLIIIFHYCGIN